MFTYWATDVTQPPFKFCFLLPPSTYGCSDWTSPFLVPRHDSKIHSSVSLFIMFIIFTILWIFNIYLMIDQPFHSLRSKVMLLIRCTTWNLRHMEVTKTTFLLHSRERLKLEAPYSDAVEWGNQVRAPSRTSSQLGTGYHSGWIKIKSVFVKSKLLKTAGRESQSALLHFKLWTVVLMKKICTQDWATP